MGFTRDKKSDEKWLFFSRRGILQLTRCDGSATSAHPWYKILI